MSLQVFITIKILAIDKIGGIKNNNKSIKKYEKLLKTRNCLNLKNWLSQEKNCQKMGIYLISTLRKMD